MPDVSRRRALQACATGLVGVVAGCVGDTGEAESPTTTTSRTTTTDRTTSTAEDTLSLGESATVGNAAGRDESGTVALKTVEGRRQYFLGRLRAGGQRDIQGDPDRKYLWTEFASSWGEQSTDCFMPGSGFARLVLDGDAYSIAEPCAYESNQAEHEDGEVVFGVPAGVTGDAGRFEWFEDGEPVAAWALPDDALAWLNDPPAFEVLGVEAPDRVRDGDTAEVTVRVRNAGGHDGTFRYLVDSAYSSAVQFHQVTVPAGETAESTSTPKFVTQGATGSGVRVDWAYESTTLSTEVVTETTTNGE